MPVRAAITAMADGEAKASQKELLIEFVEKEIWHRLRPPAGEEKSGGDVYHWLTEHGYPDGELKRWLFAAPPWIPHVAARLVEALQHGQCGCHSLAFSPRSKAEALKRCEKMHWLTRANLDAFILTAEERVEKSTQQWDQVSEDDRVRAVAFQQDVQTFVRRAVHGITKVSTGPREFGQSMLAAVMETPRESQLRIRPWTTDGGNKTYSLYDTRDGIVGCWPAYMVFCPKCKLFATSPTSLDDCNHLFTIASVEFDQEPDSTFALDVARCARRCGAHWPWRNDLKKCPQCDGRRRKVRLKPVVSYEAPPISFDDSDSEEEE